ncbi:hypothetical protein FOVSG1_010639 [Fusarium oxysporum f. sp. vasinfectum]
MQWGLLFLYGRAKQSGKSLGLMCRVDRIHEFPVVCLHAPPNRLRYVPSQAGRQIPNGVIRTQRNTRDGTACSTNASISPPREQT